MRFKSLYLAMAATALSSITGLASAEPFKYSTSHYFKVPTKIQNRPFTEITFPGTHNSWNTKGVRGGCGYGGDPLFNDNNNTDANIVQQAERGGLAFFEIDVYDWLGDWCVVHGGQHADGNPFYFKDILDDIVEAQQKTGEVVFLKIDRDSSTKRDNFITDYFNNKGLLHKLFKDRGQYKTVPSYEKLKADGVRFVIIFGSQEYRFPWQNVSTNTKHHNRSEPFTEILSRRKNEDNVRWNAFTLSDLGWGDKNEQRYITSRLVPGAIEKWIQTAHRISQIAVDYGDMIAQNMSPARAANILNQVPSAYGKIVDENGQVLKDVGYKFVIENINLQNHGAWLTSDDYLHKEYYITSTGDFDFPRPHGQEISIRPHKQGYRFEPEAIYLNAEDTAESVEVKFTAIKKSNGKEYTLQEAAESYSFIYKKGKVRLAAGLGIDANGQPVVNDVTKQKGFALVNQWSGHCATLPKNFGERSDGIFQEGCDGSVNQRWSYDADNSLIRSMAPGNYCLTTEQRHSDGAWVVAKRCPTDGKRVKGFHFALRGHEIQPQLTDGRIGLAVGGSWTKAPLWTWHKDNYHPNDLVKGKWVFQKQYVVSSDSKNIVTDASTDDRKQYFMLPNFQAKCLNAIHASNGSKVNAVWCASDSLNSDNMLWYQDGNKIRLKANNNLCLSHTGGANIRSQPEIADCSDTYLWDYQTPYGEVFGKAFTLSTKSHYNSVLNKGNPESSNNHIDLWHRTNDTKFQAWTVVPVDTE